MLKYCWDNIEIFGLNYLCSEYKNFLYKVELQYSNSCELEWMTWKFEPVYVHAVIIPYFVQHAVWHENKWLQFIFFNVAENEEEICQRKVIYKRTLGLLVATWS